MDFTNWLAHSSDAGFYLTTVPVGSGKLYMHDAISQSVHALFAVIQREAVQVSMKGISSAKLVEKAVVDHQGQKEVVGERSWPNTNICRSFPVVTWVIQVQFEH